MLDPMMGMMGMMGMTGMTGMMGRRWDWMIVCALPLVACAAGDGDAADDGGAKGLPDGDP